MRVAVAEACPDTSAIRTDAGRQHCARCKRDVLDLRFVTERRAVALIAAERARSGEACISLFIDGDGAPSFLVEPVPRRRLPILPFAFAATIASACGVEETTSNASPTTIDTPRTSPSRVDVGAPPIVVAPLPTDASADVLSVDASVCAAPDAGTTVDATTSVPATVRRTRPAVGRSVGSMSFVGADDRFEWLP